MVAVFFGQKDTGLTLFGFGVDSFIEVISGLGIAHMVVRIRREPGSARGIKNMQLIEGVEVSNMAEPATWAVEADKVFTFDLLIQ